MTDDKKPDTKPTVADKPVADKPVVEPSPPASGEEAVSSGQASTGTDQQGRQLYDVTCASCGKPAQVPFKPSGDRPVYCRDCYMKQRRG